MSWAGAHQIDIEQYRSRRGYRRAAHFSSGCRRGADRRSPRRVARGGPDPTVEMSGIERFGEVLPPETVTESEDVLIFTATEAGVADLWTSPLFGLPPQRLYAVTVTAGEGRTLHDIEDGSIRVIGAARIPSHPAQPPHWPATRCSSRATASPRSTRTMRSRCGRGPRAWRRNPARRSSPWASWPWSCSRARSLMVLMGVLRPALRLGRSTGTCCSSCRIGRAGCQSSLSGLADVIADCIRIAVAGNAPLS